VSERTQTSPGADWAMWDVEVARKFGGQWVVAIPNEVIDADPDAEVLRVRAAAKLQLPPEEIVVCAVAPPDSRVYG
jgi:hypothetical protein